MPIGNMIFRAAKEDVWGKPSTDLGPGDYEQDIPDFKPKTGLTPFNSTAERVTGPRVLDNPGPGAYETATSCIKVGGNPSPEFQSRSMRGLDVQLLRNIDNPGPGHYTGDIVKPLIKTNNRIVTRSYNVTNFNLSTVPSIPLSTDVSYTEGADGLLIPLQHRGRVAANLGPGSYNPRPDLAKNHGRIHIGFGKVSGAKMIREGVPGPGSYNPYYAIDGSFYLRGGVGSLGPHSVFSSKTRRSEIGGKTLGAGPGAFDTFARRAREDFLNPNSRSLFGSYAKNSRPDLYTNDVPGPGTYTLPSTLMQDTRCAALTTAAPRFVKSKIGCYVGPGTYDDPHYFGSELAKKHGGNCDSFGSKDTRFKEAVPAETRESEMTFFKYPQQRAASRERVVRMSPAFASKASRSLEFPNASGALCYDVNYEWPKSINAKIGSFGGAARSTGIKDPGVPGPGSYNPRIYHPREDLYRAVGFGGASRFPFTGFEETPGPGTYNLRLPQIQKSFNVTIGDTWE